MPLPVEPLVEIVRVGVLGLLPVDTGVVVKLQGGLEGFPEQESVTGWPKAAFTDDTVTVMAAVVCPLVVEMLVGEMATEKSGGAAPTLATNASARPPPYAACNGEDDTGKPVVLVVSPARYALLVESTATAPIAGWLVKPPRLFSLPVPPK